MNGVKIFSFVNQVPFLAVYIICWK